MEENKYYTPEIEELYIGFECEFFNDMQGKEWEKEVCDADTISIAFDTYEHGTIEWDDDFSQKFRVKHLDKEDLIELGFEEVGQEEYYLNGDLNSWCIEALYNQSIKSYYRIDDGETQRMFLEIKNKSELIKVLKMLGIK